MSTRRENEAIALSEAYSYRNLGLVPLPSRDDEKSPALASYKQYRVEMPPDSMYSIPAWSSTNIQLVTGAKSPGSLKILVVDCDGDRGRSAFRSICARHGLGVSRFWVSRSPSGGRHVYFRVPTGVDRVPTRMIWGLWDTWGDSGEGRWEKHMEVKILGDGSLAVAPPSFHVEHGARYEWEHGFSPGDHPVPSDAPPWLLAMPAVVAPPRARESSPRRIVRGASRGAGLDAIQDAIPPAEKLGIAVGWGLVTSGPGNAEWVHCHAVGREDSNASAGFHPRTGRYKDHATGEVLSFFQLGVALGRFDTPARCAEWCSYHRVVAAGG